MRESISANIIQVEGRHNKKYCECYYEVGPIYGSMNYLPHSFRIDNNDGFEDGCLVNCGDCSNLDSDASILVAVMQIFQ